MYLTLRDRAHVDQRAERRQRVAGTVVLLGIVSMLTDVSSESVNAVLPKYLVFVVGLSPQAFGLVNGLYTGVSAAVRLAGGWLADRADHPKWVAGAGYLISALSRVGLLFANGFGAISAVVTVDRLGKGLRTAPRDSIIATVSEPKSYGRAFGTHRALDTVGAAAGPLLAFWILTVVTNGFHAVFVTSLAFAAVGVVVLTLLVPDVRPRRIARSDKQIVPIPLRSMLANHALARIVIAAGLLGLVTVGDAFVYLQIQLRYGLSNSNYALQVVLMNVAYLVLAVPLGRVADRVGRTRVFLAGHLALAACYFLAAGPIAGTAVSVLCLVMLGTFYAATDGILAALAGQAADPRARTTGIALAQTVQALAAFVSSLLAGALWAWLGLTGALRWYLPVLLLAIPIAALVLRGAGTRTPAAATLR